MGASYYISTYTQVIHIHIHTKIHTQNYTQSHIHTHTIVLHTHTQHTHTRTFSDTRTHESHNTLKRVGQDKNSVS